MYKKLIDSMKTPPVAYETTGIAFWDDEHVSKQMLINHLAPDSEGASRNHAFIKASAEWICSFSAPGSQLLDLGCGPGLYAELFCDKGYLVTGIDFSKRSIEYAIQSALDKGKNIAYAYQDYLTIDFHDKFDVTTLIYCDFGVLSPEQRKILLEKVYSALKPGGYFFMDTFTSSQYENFVEQITTAFEDGGFWRAEPYLCIKRDKRYESNDFLEQYTIITQSEQRTYNLWNHAFSREELKKDLQNMGFADISFYGDVTGQPFTQDSPTFCVVCRKPK